MNWKKVFQKSFKEYLPGCESGALPYKTKYVNIFIAKLLKKYHQLRILS